MTLPSTPSSKGARRRLHAPGPSRSLPGLGDAGSSYDPSPPKKWRRRPAALVGVALVTVSALVFFSLAATRRVARQRPASATPPALPSSRIRQGKEQNQQHRPPLPASMSMSLSSTSKHQIASAPTDKLDESRNGGTGTTKKDGDGPGFSSPQEKQQQPNNETDEFHVVFSTDCSKFLEWQSYVFFHRAMVLKQPGTVTRIASGCSPQEQSDSQARFDETISPMTVDLLPRTRFRIHFTPDYSRVKGGVEPYKYFNKPFGVRHWMENVLNYNSSDSGADANPHDRSIVVLVDPDELLLRPFATNNFSDLRWIPRPLAKDRSQNEPQPPPRWSRVEPGKPIGQLYAYELQWKQKINMTLLVPPDGPTSPVDEMSDEDALEGYVVGPPLLATARDMYKIVTQWAQFAPLVHDQYPHLLAEMFAYSLASAHLKLSHQTSTSLMISDTTSPSRYEDWSYVDELDLSTVCRHDVATDPGSASIPPPRILHYCQDYGVGYWFFSKYEFPHKFLTCEHPLFRLPPADLAAAAVRSNLTHYVDPGGAGKNVKNFNTRNWAGRTAFATCTMLRAANDASTYYKSRHCSPGTANLNETFTHHPAHLFPSLE